MHRRSVKALLALVVIVVTAVGMVAFAGNSSALVRNKKAISSNNYEVATCFLTVDSVSGAIVKAHISSQARAGQLGFLVTSTTVVCQAFDASDNLIGTFTKSNNGGGAYVQASRKNFVWALSTNYIVCATSFIHISGGADLQTPVTCST